MSCDLKKAQGKVVNLCLLGDDLILTSKLQIHIVPAASVSIAPLPCLYSANSYSNCNELKITSANVLSVSVLLCIYVHM